MSNQKSSQDDAKSVFRKKFIAKLLAHIGAIMSAATVSFFLFVAITGGIFVCMQAFGQAGTGVLQCKQALDLTNPEWMIEGPITIIHSPIAVLVLTLTGTAEVGGIKGVLYMIGANHTDS